MMPRAILPTLDGARRRWKCYSEFPRLWHKPVRQEVVWRMLVQLDWEQAIGRLETLFNEAGFTVVRSFDLQLARKGLLDPSSCPCPHHGTDRCTCQYLVYLLYADDPDPITVVVHGHDQRTEVSVESGPNGQEQALRAKVGRMLQSPDIRTSTSRI